MARVTERDREAANRLFFLCGSLGDFDAACAFLAEWREARMAESEAARQTMAVAMQEAIDREVDARLKAEGERDEALARVRKWERHEIVKASCCDDNEQRAIKAEAHLREFEQHEAETHASLGAILGTDTSLLDGAKRMQARLRAVIEAADKVWSLAKTLGLLHPDLLDIAAACNAYRRVRDAQASPEPFARIDAAIARIEKQREEIEALKRASPEPEADLAAEVALGITHSTACSRATPCCRCRAIQLELCIRESVAAIERMLAHPEQTHQWPMGMRALRDRSKSYLKAFGTGAIQP